MVAKGKTSVVNVRYAEPGSYFYVGRPNKRYGLQGSLLQNPYPIRKGYTRAQSLRDYECHLWRMLEYSQQLWAWLDAIRGKRLGCWCKRKDGTGLPCHADLIAWLADADWPTRHQWAAGEIQFFEEPSDE